MDLEWKVDKLDLDIRGKIEQSGSKYDTLERRLTGLHENLTKIIEKIMSWGQ